MPVAFVLSGGASLAASQAGMVEALYEQGICPELLVGTSAGAINAAFLASRPPTARTARDLQQIWLGLKRSRIFPVSALTAGLGIVGRRDHLVAPHSLRRLLARNLELERLEDARVKLHVVATDLASGAELLLSSGPTVDAVMASAAIPGVFKAVEWESRVLVDGGIVNNTPISHAVELGADRVYVLQAAGTGALARTPRSALAAGVAAISLATTRRFPEDLARYRESVDLTVLTVPQVEGIRPTDFGHASELIAAGLSAARATLASTAQVLPLRQVA